MKADDTPYRTLRKIQLSEGKFPLLTKIDKNFYSQISEYQKNLDDLSEKEIQDIERIISSVYGIREKKIVQAALSKIRGGKPDLKNILDEEKKLFDSVIDSLLQSRKNFVNKD
jgi:DNA replication initiation complex subunit (GINS family)